jgi:hypothetical protein
VELLLASSLTTKISLRRVTERQLRRTLIVCFERENTNMLHRFSFGGTTYFEVGA